MHSDLEDIVKPAQFVYASQLSQEFGCDITVAHEINQTTGSFKIRAAYHVARNVPHHHIITASSGNFGQALSYACMHLGKQATVVMPHDAPTVKIDGVRKYGATVDLIDTKALSRAGRIRQLASNFPNAYIASPYDDTLVIEGNASLGREIAQHNTFDYVVTPIGGGGLTSGVITGLRSVASAAETIVVAAEPEMANDAYRSLREGRIVSNDSEPLTIADGARTISIGKHNWEIIRNHLHCIVPVPEEYIALGVSILYHQLGLRAEPTAGLSIGALYLRAGHLQGKRVCCVVSGGNVDDSVFNRVISGN